MVWLLCVAVTVLLCTVLTVSATGDQSQFQVLNGTLVSYHGTESKVVIPERVNGQVIEAIGVEAFAENAMLEEVYIPDTVTAIQEKAFLECFNLKTVKLPKELKQIGIWAFGYCESLEQIEFPQNLEVIDSAAFYGCVSLTRVTLPDDLSRLGTHCFRACYSLAEVKLPVALTTLPLRTFSGCRSLKTIVLPEGLQSIDSESFYQAGLEQIRIPGGVKSIGARAFYECGSLREVFFAEGVVSVEEEAFYNCVCLEEIILPRSLQLIGQKAFASCLCLKQVDFLSVEKIAAQAFSGCRKLQTVVLPENLKEIGIDAFAGCRSLVELTNLSSMGLVSYGGGYGGVAKYAKVIHKARSEKALLNATADGFIFMTIDGRNYLVGYGGTDSHLNLPQRYNGETYIISAYAFRERDDISEVRIPDGVSVIQEYAFSGCSALRRVKLPESLTHIKTAAFSSCEDLLWVTYDGTRATWDQIQIDGGNEALSGGNLSYLKELVEYAEERRFSDQVKEAFVQLGNDLSRKIFAVNLVLMMLWAILLLVPRRQLRSAVQKKRNRIVFITLCCVQWVLISGLRADSVGADTENYLKLFDEHISMSWSELWRNVKLYYAGNEAVADYEIGYVVFEKLLSLVTTSHLVYKLLIATIFMVPFGIYVYKNSEDPFLSFLVYDALMYNMFSLTGYRQVVSVAIAILLGYEFVKKRKFIPFLLLVLIASLFHKSTLIFLVFYFLANKKITTQYLLGTLAVVVVLIFARNSVFNYVKYLVGYEQYSGEYGFAQQAFLLLVVALTVAAFFFRRQILGYAQREGVTYVEHYYNAFVLTWYMIPFAMVSPTSMRLVYDFGFISFLLLIPVFAKSFRKSNDRAVVYLTLTAVLSFFIFTKTPEYLFFWQS